MIMGKSLLATLIQSLLSLEYLIDLSAKIIAIIRMIIFTKLVAIITFIKELNIWLNNVLLVLKKKLTIRVIKLR